VLGWPGVTALAASLVLGAMLGAIGANDFPARRTDPDNRLVIIAAREPGRTMLNALTGIYGSDARAESSRRCRHTPVRRSTVVTTSLSGIVVLIS
jgi:hypothetical protein